jgi:hypothetical protein
MDEDVWWASYDIVVIASVVEDLAGSSLWKTGGHRDRESPPNFIGEAQEDWFSFLFLPYWIVHHTIYYLRSRLGMLSISDLRHSCPRQPVFLIVRLCLAYQEHYLGIYASPCSRPAPEITPSNLGRPILFTSPARVCDVPRGNTEAVMEVYVWKC